jgi:class 3 adenylate cyclase/Tfp pilus assembly protein PilF
MKWFFVLALSCLSLPGFGQLDSIYKLPFKDRLFFLREKWKPQKLDSASIADAIQSLNAFAEKQNDPHFSVEAEITILNWSVNKHTHTVQEVEEQYNQILKKSIVRKDPRLQAIIYQNLGELYWNWGNNYTIAIQYFEKAYFMVRNQDATEFHLKQQIIYNLGEKYFFLKDFPNSIRFIKEASKLTNPWEPIQSNIRINNTLGLAYRSFGKLDSAEISFMKALKYAEQAKTPVWVGTLSGNLGSIYLERGELEKGMKMLERDKNISLQRNARGSAVGALVEMARINLELGNLDKAIEQVDSAILISKNKMPYARKRALFPLLSDIYALQGDYPKANLYLDSTILIIDSLSRQERALQTLRLNQRIELEESRTSMARAETENERKTSLLYGTLAVLLLALGAIIIIFRQKQKTDSARKRSDELLLNILPVGVATELKNTGKAVSRKFPQATVLFSDFKNFTNYAENLGPEELVHILDDYFRAFDQVVEEFGLEKIKTIGDAYMCVCGLPNPDPDHAEKAVQAAFRMQEIVEQSTYGWQLRIGIHSGPIVAGIVGIKKFAYDIWGDTVNIAARMEQNSEPGKINISKASCELVKDKFTCIYRGKLEAKNKGSMEMYFVEKKPA